MDIQHASVSEKGLLPCEERGRFDLPRLPFKAQLLALLTALGASSLMDSPTEAAPAAQHERPALPLDTIYDGTWGVSVDGATNVRVTSVYGDTLYAFIKGELRKQNAFPNKMTKENEDEIVTALITACRELNPSLKLDDFASIHDKEILFPISFDVRYQSDSPEKSERALLDLAEMDGYAVDEPKVRDVFYRNALQDGVSSGSGEGLFRLPGYEKSPDYFLPDAYEMLQGADVCLVMSSKTHIDGDNSMHWVYAYTDVLRDTRLQKLEDPSNMENIHYTGRALNVSDGTFLAPDDDGEPPVTWKKNKELRYTIEHRLRPTIEDCFEQAQAALYHNVKGGFYDVYFPKDHPVQLTF